MRILGAGYEKFLIGAGRDVHSCFAGHINVRDHLLRVPCGTYYHEFSLGEPVVSPIQELLTSCDPPSQGANNSSRRSFHTKA